MNNKLALGTVQFGLSYGINNARGQVPITDVKKIIQYAKESRVCIIDTAQAYGNSEEVLGSVGMQEFNVVSKITSPKQGTTLKEAVLLSLKHLQLSGLYGLLLHDFDYWQSEHDSWINLQQIKEDGLIKKIGFSLYHPEQWLVLKKNEITPDLLQIPVNLLNQQFMPYLSEFKRAGVEIHVRSAFLQGLLLMETESIPVEFLQIKPQLNTLKQLSEKWAVSKINICLLWLWQNDFIDHIVLGVDGINQWQENLAAAEWCQKNYKILKIDPSLFLCENENIIDPSKWKN